MVLRARLLAVAGFSLLCMAAGVPAHATALLPHKATYALSLDGSKPTGQLEDMRGRIDYEITGDACAGYKTLTRQESESTTGDGSAARQQVTAKAWEAGDGQSYRFLSTTESGDDTSEVEASVTREDNALQVAVTKPEPRTLAVKGKVLMPTEHVVKILAAAAAGESVLEARVYDGASDPEKVYETLTVIGRASTEARKLAAPAQATLAGHTFYPVSVSYFEPGPVDRAPAYVMSFSLYDNGVVGDLKIDYGRFALIGAMSAFEALQPAGDCSK